MTGTNYAQQVQSCMSILLYKLNSSWHKPAMTFFMIVIFSHLLEHLFQAYQFFILGWTRQESLGALGLFYPWLMRSEWLHYGHALFMLLGLALLRPAIVGKARVWWDIAFGIQFWHHFEHALLLGQVVIHQNLFDSPIPMSILQLWVPRLELHLFYNLIVLAPMLVALWYHRYPPTGRELGI